MYLMYIDESGDPGVHTNSPTRYFYPFIHCLSRIKMEGHA